MKAYNEQWIYNRDVLEQAERWFKQGMISEEQVKAARKAYPVEFRQTNTFLEIGLFLFTTVAILACYLLPASLFASFSESAFINMGFGVGVGVIGQLLINQRLLCRNGIDNAFIVTMTGFLAFGFNQLFPPGLSTAKHCFLTLPLLGLVLWYYGDTLIAFFCLATFYTGIFNGLLHYSWGKDALPFVMMLVSFLLYTAVGRAPVRSARLVYYTDPLNLTQWLSLIVLAASGSYFVVRELNGLLLMSARPGHPVFKEAPEIGLAPLFWLLTFLIPAFYLWRGIRQKNRMLLILGALGMIAAVATVHEYHPFTSLNVFLALGGLVLTAIAVFLILRLAKARYGFTDVPDVDSPDEFWTNAGTLVAMQTPENQPRGSDNTLDFGKGDFGGGGSDGTY